jgi:hypothetical protein
LPTAAHESAPAASAFGMDLRKRRDRMDCERTGYDPDDDDDDYGYGDDVGDDDPEDDNEFDE